VRKTLEGHNAFFPNPLPRRFNLAPETVTRLDRATAALHRLGGLSRLLPNPQLLVAPHLRLEAVLSSKIEGTQSSVADLLLYEAQPGRHSGLPDDVREVDNYVRALEHALKRLRQGFPLSLRLVKEVHERLLSGVRGHETRPGRFRTVTNWIGSPGSSLGDATFVPPPVEAIEEALSDFERFLHERDLPLLVQLAMIHYQFEAIHPFIDGNGRVGRLLIPLVLCAHGALEEPLLYLSAYFERNRSQYYRLLLRTSQLGDLGPWFAFFFQAVETQAAEAEERTIRLVDGQRALREELLAAGSSSTALRLADMLFMRPYVSARRLQEDLGVSFPTAQKAIDLLVRKGLLAEISGRQRGRLYFSEALFHAVYGDNDPKVVKIPQGLAEGPVKQK